VHEIDIANVCHDTNGIEIGVYQDKLFVKTYMVSMLTTIVLKVHVNVVHDI